MSHLPQLALASNSNEFRNKLSLYFDSENDKDLKQVHELQNMAQELSTRVKERGELICPLHAFNLSHDALESLKLIKQLQEHDMAKTRRTIPFSSGEVYIWVTGEVYHCIWAKYTLLVGRFIHFENTRRKEQAIQQLQMQPNILKQNSMNKVTALKTTTQRLEKKTFTNCPSFQRAFSHLFHTNVRTFKYELSLNMNNLKKQLDNEILHEKDSKSVLSVIKVQFDKFIHSEVLEPSNYNSYDQDVKANFKDYTQMEAQTFIETIIQNMESIEQYSRVQENQSNTFGNESSRSRNECNDKSTFEDDTDIRPSYDTEPMVEVPYTAEYNVFAVETQHSEQPESINNTCVVEKVDSNVIPDSSDMYDNDIQTDQNVKACDDERVALANLIENLKLDIDENKKIKKQLKKANASLTQELKECKSTLAETSRTLWESNSIHDSCLIALQNKQTELETYKTLNDRTVDYDKLEFVKEKHDELVKQSLLTKSHYEGLVKEKTNVITDLKLKEEKDIDKMISMEKQLKFLNEIVYKRNQSIQTIHMLAPKGPTFNEEAKKKAQLQKDKSLNTKPSVQQSARLPNTANGNKLKPRNFNHQPRNWPPSMSSRVLNRTVNIAKPHRNQKTFLKSKDLACPT
ncbi:hypothetical protein Tco_1540745 [Tanacetum coccineum]